MAAAAASITLQLNSRTATPTSEGSYRLDLEPPISVPYLAAPRAQLTDMAFVNTGLNVSSKFGNNLVEIQLAYIESNATGGQNQTVESLTKDKDYTITIPDGHYDIPGLETEIAAQMYKLAGTKIDDINRITATTSLWQDMNLLVKTEPDPTTIKTRVGALGGHNVGDTHTSVTIVSTLPQHDAADYKTIVPATYLGAAVSFADDGGLGDAGDLGVITNIDGQVVTFSKVWTPDSVTTTYDFTFVPISTRKGYGVGDITEPSLDPTSHWAEVLPIELLQLIARTPGTKANGIIPEAHRDDANKTVITQADRYVKPMYLKPDPTTNMMRVATAYPGFAIQKTSTLFTKVLGFKESDPNDFATQDPFLREGKLWTASNEGSLERVRTVVFHCPTLIDSSYDSSGKRSGAQLQVVPVSVPSGAVQVWQSQYDNSIPCQLHGGDISSIEFYIRDQDLDAVELQNTAFQATIRLTWDDPRPPQIGSAGADDEDAYGLRDVVYGYQR
eukprot:COSAG04_NODE_1527_length_6459_cov_1.844025_4_plen_501_part_00